MRVKQITLVAASFVVCILLIVIMLHSIVNDGLQRISNVNENKVINKYVGEN